MNAYRMYFLDKANHICDVSVIEFDSDGQALSYAQNHPDERAKELWCGTRRVGHIDPPLEFDTLPSPRPEVRSWATAPAREGRPNGRD